MKLVILSAHLLFMLVSMTQAGVIPSIGASVRTVNYTGILAYSDATTGHSPDRSKITGEWGLNFEWDAVDTEGAMFESTLWFEDEAGVKVPIILDGGGPAVTEVVEEYQVSLNSMNPADQHMFSITFRPQSRLLPNKRYTMKAKYRGRTATGSYGSIYIVVPLHSTAPTTRTYAHFDNFTSGDAALNARSEVDLTSWNRRWMIASSTTQGSFSANLSLKTTRFDDVDTAATFSIIHPVVSVALKRVSDGVEVWSSSGQSFSQLVGSHSGGTGALAEPASVTIPIQYEFTVPAGVLSADETYTPIFTVENNTTSGGSSDSFEGEVAFAAQPFLRFTGKIYFGSLLTYGNEVSNDPVEDLYPNASPLPTSTLGVVAGQGTIPSSPGATYGGTPLAVSIQPNGDAIYGDGTQISVQADENVVHQGVTYTRTGVYLTTTGPKASTLRVHLPSGMGYTYTAGSRVMKSKITATNVSLEPDLLPSGISAFEYTQSTYVTLERLPLVFSTDLLSFSKATGKFTFTPTSVLYEAALELGVLEGYALNNELIWPAGLPLHAGNNQVFRGATVSGQDPVEVSVGEDGAAYIHTLQLGFQASAWWTHFPLYWLVSTSGAGTASSLFEITNDQVDQASLLGGVQGVNAYYIPDPKPESGKVECPGGVPKVGGIFFSLVNQDQRLRFLADGSLDETMTAVSGNAPLTLFNWGTFNASPDLFAHQIDRLSADGFQGKVMLPSHFLGWRGAEISGLADVDRTAALHLSGRGFGTGGTQVEYPHQAEYQSGLADYAGLNLRRSELSDFIGTTRFGGGPPANYLLLPESKLYIRSGGVSGTIQSATDLGPVPVNGFDFQFDGVKLAFLDNCVAGSALDGGMTVGGAAPAHPCNFTLDFLGLRLWSNGALDRGIVDPNQGGKALAYWRTDIFPLSMEFIQPNACSGPAGESLLALGVETVLPALAGTKPLHGVLGFNANGSLVTKQQLTPEVFAKTGLDSRLKVPGNVKLKGPGSSSFSVTPVCGVYLNHWPGSGAAPTVGYANLAGSVDVPFFENLTVHLHATANSNASQNASVHVMQPPAALGPFTLAEFDPGNLGVPSDSGVPLALETYRTDAAYRVRAKKSWLGLVDFDFPMRWNSSQRLFEMNADESIISELIVANVKSRARSLSPTTADLKFNAELGVSLPSIDANTLLGQALEGVGVGSPLSALQSVVPSFGTVMNDLAFFEELLADTPAQLVKQPLLEAISLVRSSLPANANATQVATALTTHLNSFFSQPALAADPALSWKQPVMVRLDKVSSVSATLKTVIQNSATVVALADALAGVLGGDDSDTVPPEVLETLDQAYGALTLLQSGLAEVRTGINGIALSPDWAPILTQSLADLPQPEEPLSATNAELADAILNRFLGDSAAATITEEMRVHVSDVRDRLRGSVDSIFAGINEMLQAGSGAVPFSGPPGVGDLADMQFGKIDGAARINGDTLHELRLDADLRLSLGSDLDFHGYVLFRDLSSDTPSTTCRTSAGVAAELTLGAATKFSFGAPAQPTKLEVEAKFAFAESGGLNGLAGRFGLSGSGFKLGVLTIQKAELGFGFGGGDGYLYGKGAGRSDWADIEAAVFLGRTCNPYDVMQRVDPQVTELLEKPEISSVFAPGSFPTYGLYAFGYGSISVNALIGIPPSPMLNLKAGSGMGAFYFTRRLDAPANPAEPYAAVIGLRQDMGVSGEVLCLADISARLSLVGAAGFQTNDPLNLMPLLSDPLGHPIVGNGKADVSLEVGVSPFDFTLHKTLRMNFSYKPGPDLDFDLDL